MIGYLCCRIVNLVTKVKYCFFFFFRGERGGGCELSKDFVQNHVNQQLNRPVSHVFYKISLKLTASSPPVRSADPLLLLTGLTSRSSDRSISASLLTLSFLADLREWNADGTRLCLNFAWSSCLCCSSRSRSCVLWRASSSSLALKISETFRVGYLNEV